MVEAITGDKRAVYPCTVECLGDYGIYGYMGVPVTLDRYGAGPIAKLALTRDEQDALRASDAEVKALIERMSRSGSG